MTKHNFFSCPKWIVPAKFKIHRHTYIKFFTPISWNIGYDYWVPVDMEESWKMEQLNKTILRIKSWSLTAPSSTTASFCKSVTGPLHFLSPLKYYLFRRIIFFIIANDILLPIFLFRSWCKKQVKKIKAFLRNLFEA